MFDPILLLSGIANSRSAIEPLFFEIGVIIIFASLLGFAFRMLKQPLIPAYVLAGVALGPFCLGLVRNEDAISTLAEIGIAFLLFVVGLEMDVRKLRSIGFISIAGTSCQVGLLSGIGFLISRLLFRFSLIESTYVAMILAFSSTMVVVKLLSDKGELDTLHGRIAVGFLLMEDLFAIITLLFITNLNASGSGLAGVITVMAVKICIIIASTLVLSRYIFPHLFRLAARNQEILFLLSITVCFIFAFMTSIIGLSISVGAFIAGISIANLPYNYEIIGKIKALRIFFTTILFTALGIKLNFGVFQKVLVPLCVLILFISLAKPVITGMICSLFGYKRRTSVLVSMCLAQTSEFSLVIVALGASRLTNHVPSDSPLPTLSILLCITTMIITSYTIKFDVPIYERIRPAFAFLDRLSSGKRETIEAPKSDEHDAILIGYDRTGYHLLKALVKMGKKALVIDFNPEIAKSLSQEGIDSLYGDVSDTEIFERIDLKRAEIIVSTVPDLQDNLMVIRRAKNAMSKAAIFVTATRVDDAIELYNNGADYVILPHFLGGKHVAMMLEECSLDMAGLLEKKIEHLRELEHRKRIGHEHPVRHAI